MKVKEFNPGWILVTILFFIFIYILFDIKEFKAVESEWSKFKKEHNCEIYEKIYDKKSETESIAYICDGGIIYRGRE